MNILDRYIFRTVATTTLVALLVLLTIVLTDNGAGIDHNRINITAAAPRTAGVNVLIKRAPYQQRDQHDMQNHRNDYRAL